MDLPPADYPVSPEAGIARGEEPLWQQHDNVPFEQSRNVPLTASRCEDAGRTTTDEPSGS